MMKIIDYVVKTSIVLAALLIMGYFFPVVSWFEKPQPRKKCPIDNNEGCINGVLVYNRVK